MEDKGPFNRILQSEPLKDRDRAAVVIVVLGIVLGLVLLILVLPPVSIFSNDDSGEPTGPVSGQILDDMPAPPAGFEAVSPLIELASAEPVGPNVHPRLTVNLSVAVSDNELVVLYTYDGDSWRRLGEAVPLADGNAVQAEVTVLPPNVAAFRPVEQTRIILGTLPDGSSLDPNALAGLTTLNIQGLRPGADGSLIGSVPANDLGVPVAPTILAASSADAQTMNSILASPELSAAHVQALLDLATNGSYAGIDLDYRTIDAGNEEAFTSFLQSLASGLRREGRTLTLTLPLPIRDGGGWNTQNVDWEAIAPLVTAIKLPPVVEQDRYFIEMEEALSFLTSRVASSKLLLTIDPYSHERGVDGLQSYTLIEALGVASTPVTRPSGSIATGETLVALGLNLSGDTGASGLIWDDTARAVTFSYTGPGGARVVWLANAFSEAFKLDLARRFQLGGVSVRDVSQASEDAGIWPVLLEYAETGAVTLVKPNGALLTPRWEVSGGTLESTAGPVVTWRAPDEPGTYVLTLIVSDGLTHVGQELSVPVQPRLAVAP
ncbi:MAG: hypothetical protein J4O04_02315 [Chloroflexi bacterium]|nr:hypothetical protein [Chloroflexota bacterium]